MAQEEFMTLQKGAKIGCMATGLPAAADPALRCQLLAEPEGEAVQAFDIPAKVETITTPAGLPRVPVA